MANPMKDSTELSSSAFSRLRVIDCASWIAAPEAATMLADLGADVIKVEPVGSGDPYRAASNQPGGPQSAHNHFWILGARGKRSIAVDLSSPQGQDVVHKLVRSADVFITNFPHKVRDKLSIDFDTLQRINPRLIYASLTAYGETGEERDRQGFDTMAWLGRSGLMDLLRPDPESAPPRAIYGIGDHACAVSLFAAIVSGLYQREVTGCGDYVSTSLLANGAWSNGNFIQARLCGAQIDRRRGRETANNALNNHYRCADGRWIQIAVSNVERQWPALVRDVLEKEQLLSDPRFATPADRVENVEVLTFELDQAFGAENLPYWLKRLETSAVPFGFIQQVDDIPQDRQMLAERILVPVEGQDFMTLSSPLSMHSLPKRPATMPPELGQHSAEILEELGFDSGVAERLIRDGIVGGKPDIAGETVV